MDGGQIITPTEKPIAATRAPWIVPLTAELLAEAIAGERDPLVAEMSEGAGFAARALNGWGYALLGRGRVLAAAGLIPMVPGRAEAWLLVDGDTRPRELAPALRHARAVLDKRQRDPFFRRIEAFIRWDAPWRASFAAALDMVLEGRLACWDPKGRDYGLYARIRRD